MSQRHRSKFCNRRNMLRVFIELTFPLTIAAINASRVNFSGVDDELSY